MLRASEVDLGIINDQATIPPTTSTIPAIIPLTIPATATSFTRSEEDSSDDLPISEYLRKFQHDIPQEDFSEPLTEFHQQVTEIHVTEDVEPQLPPKKDQFPKNKQFRNNLLKKNQESL